jgi:hypothetical protein
MVALNIQSVDMPLRINNALFALNAGCGYLLKPPSLRQSLSCDDTLVAPPPNLKLKVVCATNVPTEPSGLSDVSDRAVDPYVTLRIVGGRKCIDSGAAPSGASGTVSSASGGTATKQKKIKAKTPVVKNSANPVFNFEVTFPVPDLDVSMLVVKLKDDSDTKIGFAALKITELREGLRCIPLLHYKNMTPLDCTIIVEIKWVTERKNLEPDDRSALVVV